MALKDKELFRWESAGELLNVGGEDLLVRISECSLLILATSQ